MNAALIYCTNEFTRAQRANKENKIIFEAFETLNIEIKKLNYQEQIHLYSAATHFLERLGRDEKDQLNPLDVFILHCNALIDGKDKARSRVALALSVIAISISIVAIGAAIGIGVGMMIGLWAAPLAFIAPLMALEIAPLVVACASLIAGIGVGALSSYMFFKEPEIKKAINGCMDEVKKSQLTPIMPLESKIDSPLSLVSR